MCGIAGIVERDRERPVEADRLADMVRSLRHRGPDDAGQVALPGAGLGLRRLSIIDLQGGRQPFVSEDKAVYLVGNDEIYKHRSPVRPARRAGPFIRQPQRRGGRAARVRGMRSNLSEIPPFLQYDRIGNKSFRK